MSSRSPYCHDRAAYRSVQGLILRHTATALSILASPDFHLSTRPSPKVHILMNALQRTPTCSISFVMYSISYLRTLELGQQLLQHYIMPIYTKEISLFPTTIPLSSQILSTGNHPSIEPTFEYADVTPDFAALSPNFSFEDQPADTIAELCRKAFDVCLQGLVPRLFAARALDENLLRPFRYCHRTWRDGAVAFRQELIEISSRWKELGLPNCCPYPLPTSDELVIYQREFDDFVAARKLKQRLICHLDTTPDGWVPTESWEVTKSAHNEAFDGIVQAMRDAKVTGDDYMSEEELRKIWPFDIE